MFFSPRVLFDVELLIYLMIDTRKTFTRQGTGVLTIVLYSACNFGNLVPAGIYIHTHTQILLIWSKIPLDFNNLF